MVQYYLDKKLSFSYTGFGLSVVEECSKGRVCRTE